MLEDVLLSIDERVIHVRKDGGLELPPQPMKGVFAKLEYFQRKVLQYVRAKRPNLEKLSVDDFLALLSSDKRKRYRDAAKI